jgi:hypothetical protein
MKTCNLTHEELSKTELIELTSAEIERVSGGGDTATTSNGSKIYMEASTIVGTDDTATGTCHEGAPN